MFLKIYTMCTQCMDQLLSKWILYVISNRPSERLLAVFVRQTTLRRPVFAISPGCTWDPRRFAAFRREIYSTVAIVRNTNTYTFSGVGHIATVRRTRRDYFRAVENRRDCPSADRDFTCSHRDLRYWISRDHPVCCTFWAPKQKTLDVGTLIYSSVFSRSEFGRAIISSALFMPCFE